MSRKKKSQVQVLYKHQVTARGKNVGNLPFYMENYIKYE